jgi:hypothetical protein
MTLHTGYGIKAAGVIPGDGSQDAIDYRLGEAGAVIRSATGVPRYGVFSPGVTGTGRADMRIDISSFVAFLGRGSSYGGVKVANVGTLTSPVFDAAPSSNSRIDVVWIRQNDSVDGADTTNVPEVGIAKGNAAATPTVPAVPTGALPLLDVKLPALVGSTDAATVTITPSAPFTAAAGGILPVRTKAELNSFAGSEGQLALQLDTMKIWARRSGAWKRHTEVMSHAESSFNRSGIGDGVTNFFSIVKDTDRTNDDDFATVPGAGTGNTVTLTEAGIYSIAYYAAVAAASTGRFAAIVAASGGVGNIAWGATPSGENQLSIDNSNFYAPAGTVLSLSVLKTTGSFADIISKIRITRLGSFS